MHQITLKFHVVTFLKKKIIPVNWIINNGLVHELYDLQPHNERSKT